MKSVAELSGGTHPKEAGTDLEAALSLDTLVKRGCVLEYRFHTTYLLIDGYYVFSILHFNMKNEHDLTKDKIFCMAIC